MCCIGCYEEMNGFGYVVTTNGVNVGDSANYSCWPGYTHVTGDLNRTCLTTLVWSGRRPTCKPTCTSIGRQKCIKCESETELHKVCSFSSPNVSAEHCMDAIPHVLGISAAVTDDICYHYECDETFDDVSSSTADWTARYTCNRGTMRPFIGAAVYTRY